MMTEKSRHEECFMRDKCAKYDECPMIIVQNMLAGKWKILILWYLGYSTLRFSDLQRKLPQVTQKVLARQLKSLEQDHLIHRKVYPVVPPKVEYSLTEEGEKFLSILSMMHRFGAEHLEEFQPQEFQS
ncbi:MAG: helix-turn-helix domain-containing protein [Sporomusaceae bacterium]|nr:helix-turn-helix domain-containing protein [Sporomusaceae bacterium]